MTERPRFGAGHATADGRVDRRIPLAGEFGD